MTPPDATTRPVARALLSVSDKRGLIEFARGLRELGVELVGSGGTAQSLRDAGLDVEDVETLTGSPEMLGGRVKTLHPRIHGGILARRDHAGDRADLEMHALPTIDLVVVNLYPFEATVAQRGVTLAEAIEKIDIGGPSMIRSAAKNQAYVGVVVDPDDYPAVLAELRAKGGLDDATRARLARKAFERTARYDAAIHAWLACARSAEAGRSVPAAPRHRARARGDAALRRESPPARGAVRPLLRRGRAAPRQGALVQQHRRRAGGARADRGVRARRSHRGGDPQAQHALRRRARRHAGRGVPARVRDRSRVAVRRHHRREPRVRSRARARGRRDLHRGADRARLRRRGARAAPEEEEPAPAALPSRPRSHHRARSAARVRRRARAGARSRARGRRGLSRRHAAQAHAKTSCARSRSAGRW